MLLPIIAASGFMNIFQLSVLGHIFSGCNCSIGVDQLVSASLLCFSQGLNG
jgi:hypothetical protein